MDDDRPDWMTALERGDEDAAQQLWEQYFGQMTRLAERRMGGMGRRTADEEDIAISAMNSFVQGARRGRFPKLNDESDLWRLLVTITTRKVTARRRRQMAQRRPPERGESALGAGTDSNSVAGMGIVAGREPTPEFAAQVSEQCQQLFDKLGDPQLCDIARWKMEGYSEEEMAAKIGRTVRTVQRKLDLIRKCWAATDDE